MNIQEEIRKHSLASDHAKPIIARRIMKAGVKLDEEIRKHESWLEKAHVRLPMDRRVDTFTDLDEQRESKWFKKYEEMMRLRRMRDMIEKSVLGTRMGER